MDAVFLTLFVSSVLAVLGAFLFVWTHGEGTRDHNDRLALLPLDDDASAATRCPADSSPDSSPDPRTDKDRS